MDLPRRNEQLLLPINSEHLYALIWDAVLVFVSVAVLPRTLPPSLPSQKCLTLPCPHEWPCSSLRRGSCLLPGYSDTYPPTLISSLLKFLSTSEM